MNIKLLLMLLAVAASSTVSAQSTWFKEWFQQKKTQKEYLINQIAALQVYAGYAKRGYEIYRQGLTLIGNVKNGEFNLHNDFFLSLKGINPEIARYARVADIVRLQLQMTSRYKNTIGKIRKDDIINSREREYIDAMMTHLLQEGSNLIDELIALTSKDRYELTDDQRLGRIDKLFNEMVDMVGFGNRLSDQVEIIALSRKAALMEIQQLKTINK